MEEFVEVVMIRIAFFLSCSPAGCGEGGPLVRCRDVVFAAELFQRCFRESAKDVFLPPLLVVEFLLFYLVLSRGACVAEFRAAAHGKIDGLDLLECAFFAAVFTDTSHGSLHASDEKEGI